MSRIFKIKKIAFANKFLLLAAVGLVLACLVNASSALVIYAANTQQISLTVEQNIINNSSFVPPQVPFTYQLTAKTANAPMPDGSSSGVYFFTINGTSELQLAPLQFDTPGIFTYELTCVTVREHGFTIDRRVYTINVHVTSDLQITTTAYVTAGNKAPKIYFNHIYRAPEIIIIPDNPPPYEQIPMIRQPGPSIVRPVTNLPTQNPPDEDKLLDELNTPTIGKPAEPGDSVQLAPSPPSISGNSPLTGDFSNPTFWIGLIITAGTLLFFIILMDYKLRRRQNN